jgi:hypothetical protein
LVNFHEIQQEGHATEGHLDAIFYHPVALTITKWQSFKFLMWMQNLIQSTSDHKMLYADRSSKDEQLLLKLFCVKPPKYERGGQIQSQNSQFVLWR